MSSVKNTYHIADVYKEILQKHPLQYDHQFTIEFIAPLGETGSIFEGDDAFGRKDSSSIECVTYWAQSAKIPDYTLKNVNVKFLANDFEVPGVIDYGGCTMDVALLIDQDFTQYKKLENWQNYLSDFSKSSGGRKIIPHVQAKINLLDNTMQYTHDTIILEGVWISKLGQIGLSYDAGGAKIANCNATFTYQYFYWADDVENPTASDPLAANAVDVVSEAASMLLK